MFYCWCTIDIFTYPRTNCQSRICIPLQFSCVFWWRGWRRWNHCRGLIAVRITQKEELGRNQADVASIHCAASFSVSLWRVHKDDVIFTYMKFVLFFLGPSSKGEPCPANRGWAGTQPTSQTKTATHGCQNCPADWWNPQFHSATQVRSWWWC